MLKERTLLYEFHYCLVIENRKFFKFINFNNKNDSYNQIAFVHYFYKYKR